jgi:hypothetical protein
MGMPSHTYRRDGVDITLDACGSASLNSRDEVEDGGKNYPGPGWQ